MASNRFSSLDETVSITILISGNSALISRVASSPPQTGHVDVHQDQVGVLSTRLPEAPSCLSEAIPTT